MLLVLLKKNTQHKLNYLTVLFVCLFVLQKFFSKIQENAEKKFLEPHPSLPTKEAPIYTTF